MLFHSNEKNVSAKSKNMLFSNHDKFASSVIFCSPPNRNQMVAPLPTMPPYVNMAVIKVCASPVIAMPMAASTPPTITSIRLPYTSLSLPVNGAINQIIHNLSVYMSLANVPHVYCMCYTHVIYVWCF